MHTSKKENTTNFLLLNRPEGEQLSRPTAGEVTLTRAHVKREVYDAGVFVLEEPEIRTTQS